MNGREQRYFDYKCTDLACAAKWTTRSRVDPGLDECSACHREVTWWRSRPLEEFEPRHVQIIVHDNEPDLRKDVPHAAEQHGARSDEMPQWVQKELF